MIHTDELERRSPVMTLGQASELLAVSLTEVKRMIRSGRLTSQSFGNGEMVEAEGVLRQRQFLRMGDEPFGLDDVD